MNLSDPTFEEIFGNEFSLSDENTAVPAHEPAPAQPGENDPSQSAAGALPPIPPLPVPLPPIPPILPRRLPVSGRYRGRAGAFEVELRVDVDRNRPMYRVSGDFFQISGSTTTYFGSFVVNAPTISLGGSTATIRGAGTFTFAAGAPVVQVTIPRRTIFQTQAPATLQFFTVGGAPGATYHCPFESIYFRTVLLETDRTSDLTTPVFSTYNTGALPSGGTARTLSVSSAYAEAGVQMLGTGGNNVINVAEAGADAVWSNAELHASMVRHFSRYRNNPQWAVWQVACQLHERGAGLYGIMFDQIGLHRQGCAVFHASIGGVTADRLRLQLYTYVHELGHCFNLLHSWQKSYATPPAANRPNSLSWMNYPWYYPAGGAAGFWSAFDFRFDNEEVIHLRHAFRNNIIMGGNNFSVGAALEGTAMNEPLRDDSGLLLALSTHQKSFALGEPVVVQIALQCTSPRGQEVHTWLRPDCGLVKLAIQKPNGQIVQYEPFIDHLVGDNNVFLDTRETIRESVYIGFGKDGMYFDQPGQYRVRAAYAALDGSEIVSDIMTLRVRYPVTQTEEELAELFIGEEQGKLLYLLGSDDDSLRAGNEAFDLVLDKYPKHAMANYCRLVKGVNAGRDFKTIVPGATDQHVSVRPAQLSDSAQLLFAVSNAGLLDSLSEKMVLTYLADVQTRSGDEKGANATLNKLSKLG